MMPLSKSPLYATWTGIWTIWHRWTTLRLPSGGVVSPVAASLPGPIEGTQSSKRATAYLDGLRGVAALMVVFMHHHWWSQEDRSMRGGGAAWEFIGAGWGYQGAHSLASLPAVKLLFNSGTFPVSLFYIVSGYALSVNAMRLVHAGRHGALATYVGSAIFRRWFRLFLPVIAVNFIWLTSWHAIGYRPVDNSMPLPAKSYLAELHRFYTAMRDFSYVFNPKVYWGPEGGEQMYNMPTWTLPDELRGSMVVFTAIIALCNARHTSRLVCQLLLCVYFVLAQDAYMAMFLLGTFLCDVDALYRSRRLPETFQDIMARSERWPLLWYMPLCIGLYIAGLVWNHPRVYQTRQHGLAALLVMIAVPRIKWCKAALESTVCQWLGRISFSLYLCHEPMLWGIGCWIYAAFSRPRGNPMNYGHWANVVPLPHVGLFGMETDVIVPAIVNIGMTLAVAELATRWIDEPSVKIARWLSRKASSITEDPHLELSNAQPRPT